MFQFSPTRSRCAIAASNFETVDTLVTFPCETDLDAWDVSSPKTIVVLSLAETCDSLRMWAHYADAHRGVALGFDTDTHSWSCQHLDVWILVPASRGDPPRCAPVQGGELILGSRELH